MASPTLRELTGMNPNPSPISESALVLIDCQQTYREASCCSSASSRR